MAGRSVATRPELNLGEMSEDTGRSQARWHEEPRPLSVWYHARLPNRQRYVFHFFQEWHTLPGSVSSCLTLPQKAASFARASLVSACFILSSPPLLERYS